MQSLSYTDRLLVERSRYEQDLEIHSLPAIAKYWVTEYLKPRLSAFGFDDPQRMIHKYVEQQCASHGSAACRFASLGSGNCDSEIELACYLRARGHKQFVIECIDLNPVTLARGRAAAVVYNLSEQLAFVEADVNSWQPGHEYNVVLANMSLHHVVELEKVFNNVKQSLAPGGTFIISDMIGRNGHQRWPESLSIVHEFWRKLPPSYRINRQLDRYEELYQNWDCSTEGFEGIRSQDILPLLIERFYFQFFFAFGNVIDPFIDRAFGPNFSADADWDRAFLHAVQKSDQQELLAGRLSPTHMLAVVSNDPNHLLVHEPPFTPEFCVRKTREISDSPLSSETAYEWSAWPHDSVTELRIICNRLALAEGRLRQQQDHAAITERELKARADWALGLEKLFNDRTDWALKLKQELDECLTRAQSMEVALRQSREVRPSPLQRLARKTKKLLSIVFSS